MSEESAVYQPVSRDLDKPIFVTCRSGNNGFTDCAVQVVRDLLRITGHPMMEFDRKEAAQMMDVMRRYVESGH